MTEKENYPGKSNLDGDVVSGKDDTDLSMCNETDSDDNYLKRSKSDEEWFWQVNSLQERFIRSSWINKFLFLEALCNLASKVILKAVLLSIRTILVKDAVEWVYNVDNTETPRDSRNILELTEEDLGWFSKLESFRQTQTLLELLKICDSCLVFNIYKKVESFFKENRGISTSVDVPRKSSLKKDSRTRSAKVSINTFESRDSHTSDFVQKKIQMLSRREEELLKFKKAKGILLPEEIKFLKKEDTKDAVDWIQVLPMWVNRKIMSYIDDKTLAGLKKVGKFWAKMIDESITEKTERQAINAKINKIVGVRPEKVKKAGEEKSEEEDSEILEELGSSKLLAKKSGFEGAMMSSSENYERIFWRRCAVKEMASSFYTNRRGAFDSVIGILACSSPNNKVNFYSTKTGAKLQDSIFDIPSPVSCLALHEDRVHIFLGCKDGSVLSVNIKTNEQLGSFKGHTKPVIAIYATTSELLSASEDNTIKYFQLWSGLCLMCFDLSPTYHISCLLLRCDGPHWSALGTLEGVLVLIDLKAKKCIQKVQLHNTEIFKVASEGDLLVTASRTGKIRVWDMSHLETNLNGLKPYYNIILESPVSSLTVHNHQIFSGCENGTLKIISLATGKVFKTMKISSQTAILGLAVDEDKVSTKLIIWHEGGIEMRTFSLLESSRNKKSMEKDNRKSKQKAPMEKTTPK